MKHTTLCTLLAALLATACSKPEETPFQGTVVFIQSCALNASPSAAGYAVQLTSPDHGGVSLTLDQTTHNNVVLLFDPGRILQAGDRINGTFYYDDKASLQYCDLNNLNNLDIPQGIFLDVNVE